ncbi:MAG TPA: hypothetical protein VF221_03860 [Chloroflexota bacterium]
MGRTGSFPQDLNRQGVDFVLTEISLANTLLDVADVTNMADHKQSARHDAGVAYRTALRFLPRLLCTSEESAGIASDLEALRTRLTAAGVSLEGS